MSHSVAAAPDHANFPDEVWRGAGAAERDRLATLLKHLPTPVALHGGPDLRIELVNDAFRRLSAGGRDVTGLTPLEAFPELAGSEVFARLHQVYATGEPWTGPETPVRYDRDGLGVVETWFDLRFESVRDAAGRVVGVLNVSLDITELVRARVRAERLRALSAALAEARTVGAVADAILEYGTAVVGADAGAVCRIAPDAPDQLEILRQRGYDVPALAEWARFPLTPAPESDAHVAAAVRTREPLLTVGLEETAVRFPLVRALAEQTGYLSWLAVPFVVEGRAVGGFGLAFRGDKRASEPDREALVSMSRQCAVALERVRLEEAEREARDAAERANRAKSEFLAVMSHELRTPLNAINGYADLMTLGLYGPVTDEQRGALERIQRSQRHLLGLINEVLNYAKVDAGAVEFATRPVRVAEAVADAEALVAPQLRAKGLGYAWAGCDPALAVQADPDKLQQILLNLLSNAVKFTNARHGLPGQIEASCDAAAGRVRIHVRDTGIGIPPDKLAAVFEPFVQVRSDLTRPHEGTGLGLAISRELARGMGGDLTAESTPGVGSTFTLTLPRA